MMPPCWWWLMFDLTIYPYAEIVKKKITAKQNFLIKQNQEFRK
jgi:hypothetical protein